MSGVQRLEAGTLEIVAIVGRAGGEVMVCGAIHRGEKWPTPVATIGRTVLYGLLCMAAAALAERQLDPRHGLAERAKASRN